MTTVTPTPERIAELAVSELVTLIESGYAESSGRRTAPAVLQVRASSPPPDMY
ncbi:hypothetical protein [Streptomyces sp. NPDC054797]